MRSFLAEAFLPERDPQAVRAAAARLKRAAWSLRRDGIAISYRRAVFVPDDETCFYLLDAESADTLSDAGRLAEVPFLRVVEAFAVEAARSPVSFDEPRRER